MHADAPKSHISILIVGKKGILHWQEDLRDAFLRLGCRSTVFHVNPASISEWIEKKKAGTTPFLSDPFLNRFRRTVSTHSPQLILFLGTMGVPSGFLDFIHNLTSRQTITAGWLPDCIHQRPSPDVVPFDTVFYFDSYMRPLLGNLISEEKRMVFLPLAVNEKTYFDQQRKRDCRLLFAGTCTDDRKWFLTALKDKLPLKVVGPGCTTLRGKKVGFRLGVNRLNFLYNGSVSVLNINQKPNTMHGLNLRPFEASAAGSLVFNQDVPDLPELFEPDKELMVYTSADELIDKFNLISGNHSLCQKIARAGCKRTLAEHTFVHRAQFILNHFDL